MRSEWASRRGLVARREATHSPAHMAERRRSGAEGWGEDRHKICLLWPFSPLFLKKESLTTTAEAAKGEET